MNQHFRDVALRELRGLPDHRRLSYLELGCGDGFILEALTKDGCTARGTTYRALDEDYIRTRPYPEGLTVDGGVDLNRPLAYPDASFDVVYSTEVIEHVESHRNFVTEACRVLKPGGWLVLTTPNLHRILSRLHFFLSGHHLTKRELIPYSEPRTVMEEYHHRCIDFPLVHWLLWKGGVRIQNLAATEVKGVSTAALVLKPLLALFGGKAARRAQKDSPADAEGRADLNRWTNHSALLTSEQICIVARKTAAAS
ncbi:MAG: class I SAM-dependent methyltransferase [Phycisphaerales bacterium]|nr:class I SAM-dependent methyltransferase [Phycisphaerales bacterium]